MTRKNLVFAILLLLLFCLFAGTAGAEEDLDPATPTDLDCTHEQKKTIIYFFDGPAYTPLGPDRHRVSGPATVEVVCVDCGEVLSSEDVSYAEEIRPHRMKKGVCALCGYKDKSDQSGIVKETPSATPGERVIIATEDEETEGLMKLTLTNEDLNAFSGEGVNVVLVRGKADNAVVALDVKEVLKETEPLDADLYLELAEREDGSLFAAVFLVDESGKRSQPQGDGVSLRFYCQRKEDVRIMLAPAGEDSLVENVSEWNEEGYWSVPYLQEGTYFLLQ